MLEARTTRAEGSKGFSATGSDRRRVPLSGAKPEDRLSGRGSDGAPQATIERRGSAMQKFGAVPRLAASLKNNIWCDVHDP